MGKGVSGMKNTVLSVTVIIVVLVLFVLLNTIAPVLDARFDLPVDLTQNEVTALSSQTKELLEALDVPVTIYTLFRTNQANRTDIKILARIQRIIDQYAFISDYIRVSNIDPRFNPAFAQQFDVSGRGIEENSVIVVNESGTRYRVIEPSELFIWDNENSPAGIIAEQRISMAISYVQTGMSLKLRILQGHNEPTMQELSPLLQTFSLTIPDAVMCNLTADAETLDPVNDILVIISPQHDLNETEMQMILDFIDGGGKILSCIEPLFYQELTNFRTIFKLFTVELGDDVIHESDANWFHQHPLNLVPDLVPIPMLVQPLIDANLRPIIPFSRSVIIPQTFEDGVAALPLLQSSHTSYSKNSSEDIGQPYASGDQQGPFTLAVAAYIDQGKGVQGNTKLVLFGGSQFLTDANLLSVPGNFSLALNCLSWLADREQAISIPPKYIATHPFILPTASAVTEIMIALFAIPVIVVICGISICIRRRRL